MLFGHRDIPLNELKEAYTNSESSFMSVHGMDVHFRDEGNQADSIPIVLIHGRASSLHTFNDWAANLKKTNRMIRMDLPAFGLTGPFRDRNYSMVHYTVFLKDFFTALGVKYCVLGRQIAWNFALERPDMVKKFILIDAAGYPSRSKSVPIAFKFDQTPVINKLLTFTSPRSLVRASVENVYFDKSKVPDSLVERFFKRTLIEGNSQAFVDRLTTSATAGTYSKIKNIEQPTLILWGAKDVVIPTENAYKFHAELPNDTLIITDNTGHTPMEESPLQSLEFVVNFLNNKR
jgi:pimeloyl-ACP methyl ester carboxylesterase